MPMVAELAHRFVADHVWAKRKAGFTTKPAGEGTGLGLSISHDIIVNQHAGSIEVESQPGEFTEFRIILPRTAASLAKSGDEREPANSRG
jgi:signal transduction histidine kinase